MKKYILPSLKLTLVFLVICSLLYPLLIAAIGIGTTIAVGNFRERALGSSERQLENTVLLLARHFDQPDDSGHRRR